MSELKWPEGKDFAFSVFDDTDLETVENVHGVYSFLKDHGFLTTKSVWPLRGQEKPRIGGDTCENAQYLDWVKSLEAEGFEIALHNVTYHTSGRQATLSGLERFHEAIGRVAQRCFGTIFLYSCKLCRIQPDLLFDNLIFAHIRHASR